MHPDRARADSSQGMDLVKKKKPRNYRGFDLTFSQYTGFFDQSHHHWLFAKSAGAESLVETPSSSLSTAGS
ncbi:MAG: hypothetical protein RL240_2770, partial [Planctomycetota bacterium]